MQCAATASLVTAVSLAASCGSAQYRCIGIGPSRAWLAETARMAFILVDGAFAPDLLGRLGPDVLGGLPHDPTEA